MLFLVNGDHLGSISVITDELGQVVERLRFDVFGLPINLNGTAKTNIGSNNTTRGYTGHEMDASTGLINMNARPYDPILGRFLSADTVVPSAGNMQGFSRYSYVLNNPLLYTDPSGHFWHIIIGAIVGGVMAGIQSDWDIEAVLQGAFVGAMAASIGGAAYGAANGGLSGAVAGGAAARAFSGFAGTAMNGGGKYLHNMLNGAFFGAVAGAITGGLIQEFQLNEVLAAMAGGYTTGYMQGGSDNARFAMYAAAGAAAVAYVVKGSFGSEQKKPPSLQDNGKLYAANETLDEFGQQTMSDVSNGNGVDGAGAGLSLMSKIKLFFRNLTFRPSVIGKVAGGTLGVGVKALDVDNAKSVNTMIMRKAIMDCTSCTGTDTDYLWQEFNNMNSGVPRSRQNIIDLIYRRNN